MNRTRFLIRVFVTLLKLYPIQFRSEFEEEMQTVFAAKVIDRASADLIILTAACLREYFSLLFNLPHEYLSEFGKGVEMSHKSRIFFFLTDCLFIAGGIFPWASVVFDSTMESFKGANEMLLYLTGGILLVAGLIFSRFSTKKVFVLAMVIGLGWGVYTSILLISYFMNPPHFAQNSYYMNLGPGLFLTLCASILAISYGLFQLSSKNKHPNSLLNV